MQHGLSDRSGAAEPAWAPRGAIKRVCWGLLALFMIGMGVGHFVGPQFFVPAVPPYLPWPLALVYVSGVFELAGGLGLLIPRLRAAAAWGLVALFIAVFPANIHVAVNDVQLTPEPLAPWVWWARLPFQALFIAWAWWMTRPDADGRSTAGPAA